MAAGADNTATFAIDFDAQGATRGAGDATGALKKLGAQIDDDSQALAGMQKALRNLQGGTSVNIKAFQDLKKQIEAKKATLAQTQEKFLQLGGTFKKNKAPTDAQTDALKSLFEQMQKGGGPLGGLAGRLGALRGLLTGSGALVVGAVAFAGALLAVSAAALVATAALLKYGIAAADAYRSERLQLEGLTKVRNWYGIAAGSASDLQSAIDNVSASSALGRDQIVGLGEGLYKAGLRGEAWADALDGLTIAQSAAGAGQAAMYQQMIAGAGRGSAAVKRVTDDIRARFGGIAKAQLLSLDAQTKKLHESFQGLFRGLKIEGFLTALKSVTDLFSQNTASGRALKQLLEFVMQPLIDALEFVAPLAEGFFLGMVLGAQQIAIEYYNVRLALKGAFGNKELFKNIDLLTASLYAGKFAAYLLAGGIGLVGVSLALTLTPFILLGAAAFAVGYALGFVADKVYSAYQAIKSVDWSGLGTTLIDGFVGGITRGVGKVVTAVKDMAAAAKNALKQALDSHSPSRVGIAIGATLPQGGAIGIQKDTPLVAKAARRMAVVATREAEPDDAPKRGGFSFPKPDDDAPKRGGFSFPKFGDDAPGGAPASAASGKASGPTLIIESGAFNITVQAPSDKAQDFAEKVREVVVAQFKGIALSMGAAT